MKFSGVTEVTMTYFLLMGVIVLLHVQELEADFHSPCYGCRLFNLRQREHPDKSKHNTVWCHYPCQCPVEELICRDGESVVKDGCGCCYMCARQQGDLCNPRALCDPKKELFCQKGPGNETGICKARVHNPCLVDGITYKDGQQFQPDCARVCTCQNGFYGCVSKCPQESKRPSEDTCHNPRLLPVPGKCCKEWTCEKLDTAGDGSSILDGTRGLESDNLILQRPLFYLTTTKATTTTTAATVRPYCHGTTTQWSPCSVTCDAGVSVRIVTDKVTCATRQERRVCLLRPCGEIVITQGRDKCTPTTRSEGKMHVRFMDCLSVRKYRIKWCTTCRKHRCCYPKRTRTRTMHFTCTGGTKESLKFMWIKKCRCDRRCYRQDKKRRRRRRRWRNKKENKMQRLRLNGGGS